MMSTKDQNLHGLVDHLEARMKADGEALERNGTYKEERSAEKGGQILFDRQTKERTFTYDFMAGIQSESGKKETGHTGRDGRHQNLGNLLVS